LEHCTGYGAYQKALADASNRQVKKPGWSIVSQLPYELEDFSYPACFLLLIPDYVNP
jgi:hypothetical protein